MVHQLHMQIRIALLLPVNSANFSYGKEPRSCQIIPGNQTLMPYSSKSMNTDCLDSHAYQIVECNCAECLTCICNTAYVCDH